jgi:hypothetical protein
MLASTVLIFETFHFQDDLSTICLDHNRCQHPIVQIPLSVGHQPCFLNTLCLASLLCLYQIKSWVLKFVQERAHSSSPYCAVLWSSQSTQEAIASPEESYWSNMVASSMAEKTQHECCPMMEPWAEARQCSGKGLCHKNWSSKRTKQGPFWQLGEKKWPGPWPGP